MEKIKVLHIVSSLNSSGGITAVVKNYLEELNTDKFAFDIAYFLDVKFNLSEYFTSKKVDLYKFDKLKLTNAKKVIQQLKQIIIESNCQIIHLHMPILHFFVKKAIAKVEKEQNRNIKLVLSSHSSKLSHYLIKSVRTRFMLCGVNKGVDKLLACSKMAGKKFFGKHFIKSGEILYNAINLEKYKKQENEKTDKLRENLGLTNEKVYCHIGRICKQKNQPFVIDIFNEIVKKEPNSILLFIGGGSEESILTLQRKIDSLGLTQKVRFLGSREDVDVLLNISRALIFPSIEEGLGIVLIEAQTSKTLCFASSVCPEESNISNLITYLPLSKTAEYWANEILNAEYPKKIQLNTEKYDIKKQIKNLENIYVNLLK